MEDGVPSEDRTLLGGDNGDTFDLEVWERRLQAGKYDGNILIMAAMLHEYGIATNRRRWRCEFHDRTYSEEDVSGEVADFAEQYDTRGWGIITALLGDNVRSNIRPARAVLYGICRAELGMNAQQAKAAIKMPAKDIMACFDWYEVDPPGKPEEPV